jgi:hypothetical protein
MTTDQKRALGIGGLGIGGFLLYRHFHPTASTSAQGLTNSTATGSITPYTPQAPLTLAPGESVYDPNSGGLYNTPTAGTAGAAAPVDTSGSTAATTADMSGLSAPPQATTPAAPNYVTNNYYPAPVTKKKANPKPAKRKPTVKRPTSHTNVKKTTKPKTRKRKVPA